MTLPRQGIVGVFCLLGGLLLAGCQKPQGPQGPGMGPPPPPEVMVSFPVTQQVTDYEDFPGRIEAINDITVRARVTGYLEKAHFKEGEVVKQGELLFEIDSRPYQAELARAEGAITQADGRLRRLSADFERAQTLVTKGAMGREDYDRILGDRTEAQGALQVAKANREMANLNLVFTKVTAPLSGRISRRWIDLGNLVKADETPLTSIVSLDPIYASFDLDERTALSLQRLIREKKIKWSPEGGLPVVLGLADEEGFSRHGSVTFADNRVDPDTGTWRLRGRFDNHDNALTPGLFVRIRLPIGDPYPALLVSEEALGTDQGQKFLYVVDADNKIDYRRVKVGRLHNGLRAINDGLRKGERIVVTGLQRVRQGVEVKPEMVKMPGTADEGSGAKGQGSETPKTPGGAKN